jgi:glutathione-regulated potassium-efflux system ancillary protein KefG
MVKILVLFAHPRFENSLVQQQLSRAARQVQGITFHDLYELYPDFDVQVKQEQALLLGHDIIVLQHPFYWYSCPPLMKQWLDLVLEHGWAYGKAGKMLSGKKMFNAVSTGGTREAYQPGGFNRFTIRQFLAPFDQTASLCNMEYYPPFVVHGTHRASPAEIDKVAEDYGKLLEGLVQDKFPADGIRTVTYLNELIN